MFHGPMHNALCAWTNSNIILFGPVACGMWHAAHLIVPCQILSTRRHVARHAMVHRDTLPDTERVTLAYWRVKNRHVAWACSMPNAPWCSHHIIGQSALVLTDKLTTFVKQWYNVTCYYHIILCSPSCVVDSKLSGCFLLKFFCSKIGFSYEKKNKKN